MTVDARLIGHVVGPALVVKENDDHHQRTTAGYISPNKDNLLPSEYLSIDNPRTYYFDDRVDDFLDTYLNKKRIVNDLVSLQYEMNFSRRGCTDVVCGTIRVPRNIKAEEKIDRSMTSFLGKVGPPAGTDAEEVNNGRCSNRVSEGQSCLCTCAICHVPSLLKSRTTVCRENDANVTADSLGPLSSARSFYSRACREQRLATTAAENEGKPKMDGENNDNAELSSTAGDPLAGFEHYDIDFPMKQDKAEEIGWVLQDSSHGCEGRGTVLDINVRSSSECFLCPAAAMANGCCVVRLPRKLLTFDFPEARREIREALCGANTAPPPRRMEEGEERETARAHSADIVYKPYKLVMYRQGDFFMPHSDSMSDARQIGSLAVQIPVGRARRRKVRLGKDTDSLSDWRNLLRRGERSSSCSERSGSSSDSLEEEEDHREDELESSSNSNSSASQITHNGKKTNELSTRSGNLVFYLGRHVGHTAGVRGERKGLVRNSETFAYKYKNPKRPQEELKLRVDLTTHLEQPSQWKIGEDLRDEISVTKERLGRSDKTSLCVSKKKRVLSTSAFHTLASIVADNTYDVKYAAWLGDLVHEVTRVTSGRHRAVLLYRLYRVRGGGLEVPQAQSNLFPFSSLYLPLTPTQAASSGTIGKENEGGNSIGDGSEMTLNTIPANANGGVPSVLMASGLSCDDERIIRCGKLLSSAMKELEKARKIDEEEATAAASAGAKPSPSSGPLSPLYLGVILRHAYPPAGLLSEALKGVDAAMHSIANRHLGYRVTLHSGYELRRDFACSPFRAGFSVENKISDLCTPQSSNINTDNNNNEEESSFCLSSLESSYAANDACSPTVSCPPLSLADANVLSSSLHKLVYLTRSNQFIDSEVDLDGRSAAHECANKYPILVRGLWIQLGHGSLITGGHILGNVDCGCDWWYRSAVMLIHPEPSRWKRRMPLFLLAARGPETFRRLASTPDVFMHITSFM